MSTPRTASTSDARKRQAEALRLRGDSKVEGAGTGEAEIKAALTSMLATQRDWSLETFGPGDRLAGVLDHIGKELDEIRENPKDAMEWIDVVILAFDGAWRAGHEPAEIAEALLAKYAKNRARTWPDWRTAPADRAIEHVRHDFASCSTPETKCLDSQPHESHDWQSLRHRWCCPGVASREAGGSR